MLRCLFIRFLWECRIRSGYEGETGWNWLVSLPPSPFHFPFLPLALSPFLTPFPIGALRPKAPHVWRVDGPRTENSPTRGVRQRVVALAGQKFYCRCVCAWPLPHTSPPAPLSFIASPPHIPVELTLALSFAGMTSAPPVRHSEGTTSSVKKRKAKAFFSGKPGEGTGGGAVRKGGWGEGTGGGDVEGGMRRDA